MKKINKLLTILIASLMVFGSAIPVAAANYTPVAGTSTTLDKYLVVEKDAEIPAAEFSFSIAAGSPAEATADTVKVWAGLNPEAVKIGDVLGEQDGKVVFTAGEAATNANAKVALADDTTDKLAAKHEIYLDFRAVNFPEPGVYRYVLSEAAAAQGSPISHDAQPLRTIDVYVEDNNGALAVTGYVSYLGNVGTAAPKNAVNPSAEWLAENPAPVVPTVADPANPTPAEEAALAQYARDKAAWDAAALRAVPNGAEAEAEEKSNKYVNEMDSADLTVSKTVTGNQGSRDQYFEFTITIGNAGNGTVMTLDMSGAETETHENSATSFAKADMDEDNQRDDDSGNEGKAGQQIIADANGAATITVYLHHGQNVVLKGLPKGATYKVEETQAAGYTKSGEVTTATAIASEDVSVNVVNDRNGVVPTGILVSAGLPIAVGAIAAGLFIARRNKKDEE